MIRELLKTAAAEEIARRTAVAFELEYQFAKPERRWRADVAWPSVQVALEIDGGTWVMGRHNRAGSVLKDMEKGNGYAVRGWIVFHTPWQWIEDRLKARALVADIVAAIKVQKERRAI